MKARTLMALAAAGTMMAGCGNRGTETAEPPSEAAAIERSVETVRAAEAATRTEIAPSPTIGELSAKAAPADAEAPPAR